uniref:Uncharacterized protein n=1 Tax=Anguilla anguilla TaxID=7936 RepID=A0A0E9QK10_ANGAN
MMSLPCAQEIMRRFQEVIKAVLSL